jgi:hypothetical protein
MRNGPAVTHERRGVLPQGHRNLEKPAIEPARHAYLPQDVEADEPEFDDTGLDVLYIHGMDTPGVPQTFG